MLPQGGAPFLDHPNTSPSPSPNPNPNPNPNPQGGAPFLDHLFSKGDIAIPLPKLALFFALKLTVLTPASLTLAVPTGVFLPCFAAGAAYGRLVGELLCWIAPSLVGLTTPGHFAIIGAAGLTAAATGAMSTPTPNHTRTLSPTPTPTRTSP